MFDFFSTAVIKITAIVTLCLNVFGGLIYGKAIVVQHGITNAVVPKTATSSIDVTTRGGSEQSKTASTTASTTPKIIETKKTSQTKATNTPKTPANSVSVAVPFAPPVTVPPVTESFSGINTKVRSALVNILCVTANGGPLEPISGTGVMIDPNGVILTNAHVAEYMLLQNFLVKDYITCVARTGSPAVNTYTLELLYLSPEWINANAHTLVEADPTGTGEHDFALFHITGRTDPSQTISLPVPHIAPNINDPFEGDGVLVGAYPAGFLGGISVQKDLYSASAISTIKKIFTFDLSNETADLMSVGGSVVAQKGSSGGAVVDKNGKIIGLIVTTTEAATTGERDLRAITLGHINRDLIDHAGISLSDLLKSNLSAYAHTFNTTVAPRLSAKLIDVLRNN